MRPGFIIALFLTAISFLIVDGRIIRPGIDEKYSLQQSILSGTNETRLQYGVLAPAVSFAIQKMAGTIVMNNQKLRLYSFELMSLFLFGAFFLLLYLYLRTSFPEVISITGLVIAQVLLALIIQDVYTEQAIFNLVFFVMGMLLFSIRKDFLLPLVIALGGLNQPQILALLLFYILLLFAEDRLLNFKSAAVILLSIGVWLFESSLLKSVYGLRNEPAVTESTPVNVPVYIVLMLILFLAAFAGSGKSVKFRRYSLLFIPLYFVFTMLVMPDASAADLSPSIVLMLPAFLSMFESSGNEAKVAENRRGN